MAGKRLFFCFLLLLLGMVSLVPVAAQEGVEVNILQWSHFVPRYDEWFDGWVTEWGSTNSVTTTVDHINLAELNGNLAAAIDAGDGPTLVEMVFPPAAFVEGLHDLTDVNEQAQEMFGDIVST